MELPIEFLPGTGGNVDRVSWNAIYILHISNLPQHIDILYMIWCIRHWKTPILLVGSLVFKFTVLTLIAAGLFPCVCFPTWHFVFLAIKWLQFLCEVFRSENTFQEVNVNPRAFNVCTGKGDIEGLFVHAIDTKSTPTKYEPTIKDKQITHTNSLPFISNYWRMIISYTNKKVGLQSCANTVTVVRSLISTLPQIL